jgi:hypothetical protein
MNKKLNTVLFLLAATVLNIFLILVLMLAGLYLVGVVAGDSIGRNAAGFAFFAVFIFAIGGSLFLYHRIVKLISKKIDMDTYFHPIIGRR